MSDAELERLKKNAQDAMRDERKRVKRSAPRPPSEPEPRPALPADRDAFGVWVRVRHSRMGTAGLILWWAMVAPAIALGVALEGGYPALVVLAIVVVLVLADAISYVRFRRWRARLPYTLEGWRGLVGDGGTLEREKWQDASITVELPEPAAAADAVYRGTVPVDERVELVQAAFMIFISRANKLFYTAEHDDNPRMLWGYDGTIAKGSANAAVIGRIYKLCAGDLAMLARKLGTFTVRIATHGAQYNVSPPSSAD